MVQSYWSDRNRLLIMAALCLLVSGRLLATEPVVPSTLNAQQSTVSRNANQSLNQQKIRFVTAIGDGSSSDQAAISLLQRLKSMFFGKSDENMVRPSGLAVKDGMLYVADPGKRILQIYDRNYKLVAKVTTAGKLPLISPVAVAVGERQVFLSDSSLGRVFVFDRKGKFLHTLSGQFQRPTGLALDEKNGNLYVADTIAHQIMIYSRDGTILNTFGKRGKGEGEFNYPTHLWMDKAGRLYVIDSLNYRIQIFDRQGAFLKSFGQQGDGSGDFSSPKGVSVDSQGHLYIVDALFDSVQIFDQSGQFLSSFGKRGIKSEQFWLPTGLFIDENNRIYVADSYNHRVQIFEFMGVPSEN